MNHDQNFKNLILDYPRQALEFFAPAEAAAIPIVARILPVHQEQLQEQLGVAVERHLAQSPLKEAIMGPVQKAYEEGFREGMQQAIRQQTKENIQLGLELKFGVQGLELMPEIRQIQNMDVLQNIFEGLKVAKNLEELKSIYQTPERGH